MIAVIIMYYCCCYYYDYRYCNFINPYMTMKKFRLESAFNNKMSVVYSILS